MCARMSHYALTALYVLVTVSAVCAQTWMYQMTTPVGDIFVHVHLSICLKIKTDYFLIKFVQFFFSNPQTHYRTSGQVNCASI